MFCQFRAQPGAEAQKNFPGARKARRGLRARAGPALDNPWKKQFAAKNKQIDPRRAFFPGGPLFQTGRGDQAKSAPAGGRARPDGCSWRINCHKMRKNYFD
jgi:hypothetical protein